MEISSISELKVGDKIHVVGHKINFRDYKGTFYVQEINNGYNDIPYAVIGRSKKTHWRSCQRLDLTRSGFQVMSFSSSKIRKSAIGCFVEVI